MYNRILVKISGEALASPEPGKKCLGVHHGQLLKISRDILQVWERGVQVALVIGGGNICRGIESASGYGMDRVTADSMGMMATIINALALCDTLNKEGGRAHVMSAIPMETLVATYNRDDALNRLERNEILIFAGGTGNPYFSTDTAAVLRALEMRCNLLLKATKVRGVYTGDPMCDPTAIFIKKLSYEEALEKRYGVMDSTAFAMLHEHNLPLVIYSLYEEFSLSVALSGEGTWVGSI